LIFNATTNLLNRCIPAERGADFDRGTGMGGDNNDDDDNDNHEDDDER
jgi:hypothetical protein